MALDLTVITATMPGREHLLAEACRSVWDQTIPPACHLIRSCPPNPDFGPNPGDLARQNNYLLSGVHTGWLAVLDDDDLWLPHHLETVADVMGTDADVIYTFAAGPNGAFTDVTDWTQARLEEHLSVANLICANALIRTSTARAVGGFPQDFNLATGRFGATACAYNDWAMWHRLAAWGARFVCVPVGTWEYRHNPEHSTVTAWSARLAQM